VKSVMQETRRRSQSYVMKIRMRRERRER